MEHILKTGGRGHNTNARDMVAGQLHEDWGRVAYVLSKQSTMGAMREHWPGATDLHIFQAEPQPNFSIKNSQL